MKSLWVPFRVALFFSLLIFGASPLFAAPEFFPPLLSSAQERDEYIRRLTAEEPWLPEAVSTYAGTYTGAGWPALFNREQVLVRDLQRSFNYDDLLRDRSPLLTLRVERLEERMTAARVLSLSSVSEVQSAITSVVEPMMVFEDVARIITEIESEIERIVQSPRWEPQGILTGLINCLPAEARQAIFKAGSWESQLEMLSHAPNLTEEAIQHHFKFAALGLPGDLDRDSLLRMAGEMIEREKRLVDLLRAKQYVLKVKALNPGLTMRDLATPLHKPNPTHFPLFEISAAEAKELSHILASTPHHKYASKLEKKLTDVSHELREIPSLTPTSHYLLREVPPYLSLYRGSVGGDCSTDRSAGFVYSPYMRVFFIMNPDQPKPVGYVSGAIVEVAGQRKFYLYDLTGPQVSDSMAEEIFHAFHASLAALQVTGLNIASAKVAASNNHFAPLVAIFGKYAQNTSGEAQSFPDRDIRAAIAKHDGSKTDTYDSETTNRLGHPFAPLASVASRIRVANLGKENELRTKLENATSPKERLFGALAMRFSNISPPAEMRQEVDRIYAHLVNKDRVTLADFYGRLEEDLAPYQLELRGKTQRELLPYLWEGYFQCPDALQAADPEGKHQTMKMALYALKRVNTPQVLLELIQSHPTYFSENAEFNAFTRGLHLEREVDIRRVLQLSRAGVDFGFLAEDTGSLRQLLLQQNEHLFIWALEQVVRQARWEVIDAAVLTAIANTLDNEAHPTEDLSLAAIEFLLHFRTTQEDVLENLKISVDEEDNLQIAFRAATALLLNGVRYKPAYQLSFKNRNEASIPERVRALAKKARLAYKASCAEIIEGEG